MGDLNDVLGKWGDAFIIPPKQAQAFNQGGMFVFDGDETVLAHYDARRPRRRRRRRGFFVTAPASTPPRIAAPASTPPRILRHGSAQAATGAHADVDAVVALALGRAA